VTTGARILFCDACSRSVPRAAVRCPWCFRPVHAGIADARVSGWHVYFPRPDAEGQPRPRKDTSGKETP